MAVFICLFALLAGNFLCKPPDFAGFLPPDQDLMNCCKIKPKQKHYLDQCKADVKWTQTTHWEVKNILVDLQPAVGIKAASQ